MDKQKEADEVKFQMNLRSLSTKKKKRKSVWQKRRELHQRTNLDQHTLQAAVVASTRYTNSLAATSISEDTKFELLRKAEKPIKFSPSVTKQNEKTESLYLHFTSELDLSSYPVETRTLLAFLIWVAESGKFTASSIDCVLYSSLCRLNVLRAGVYLDAVSQYAARALIASLYRDPSIKQKMGGMLPLIPDDVAKIIKALDFRSPLSYALAALFTFALSTGARGNSCGCVRLRDLGPLFI